MVECNPASNLLRGLYERKCNLMCEIKEGDKKKNSGDRPKKKISESLRE